MIDVVDPVKTTASSLGSLRIFQVETADHRIQVGELFAEYMEWVHSMIYREFGFSFDLESKVREDMAALDQFLPPKGRLLLARQEDHLAGLGCLRRIGEGVGEVKRMYVRPGDRRKGVGSALLDAVQAEARRIGYSKLRLDSARFMKPAHAMYSAAGFKEIPAYPESEVPQDWRLKWIFMEKPL